MPYCITRLAWNLGWSCISLWSAWIMDVWFFALKGTLTPCLIHRWSLPRIEGNCKLLTPAIRKRNLFSSTEPGLVNDSFGHYSIHYFSCYCGKTPEKKQPMGERKCVLRQSIMVGRNGNRNIGPLVIQHLHSASRERWGPAICILYSFYSLQNPVPRPVLPTFRVNHPNTIYPIYKPCHRHAQGFC